MSAGSYLKVAEAVRSEGRLRWRLARTLPVNAKPTPLWTSPWTQGVPHSHNHLRLDVNLQQGKQWSGHGPLGLHTHCLATSFCCLQEGHARTNAEGCGQASCVKLLSCQAPLRDCFWTRAAQAGRNQSMTSLSRGKLRHLQKTSPKLHRMRTSKADSSIERAHSSVQSRCGLPNDGESTGDHRSEGSDSIGLERPRAIKLGSDHRPRGVINKTGKGRGLANELFTPGHEPRP